MVIIQGEYKFVFTLTFLQLDFCFLSHIICFPLANKQNACCMLCFSDLVAKPYKDVFQKFH